MLHGVFISLEHSSPGYVVACKRFNLVTNSLIRLGMMAIYTSSVEYNVSQISQISI